MTKLHGIQPVIAGNMDTRYAQVTTVQHAQQEIQDMTPQKNAETPKEAPLGMIGGCLKFDRAHQKGTI